MKNNNEFQDFINSKNRIFKGTDFKVLREESLNAKGEDLFTISNPYYAKLERDLIISEEYKPSFENKIIENEEETILVDIPNPYINFIFKTGKITFTYDNIRCVNQINGNKYEVRTINHDFLIEKLDYYLKKGTKMKIFEIKDGYALSYTATLMNELDSSMEEKRFNLRRRKDKYWKDETVTINAPIDSISKVESEENEFHIKIGKILYIAIIL